MNKKQAAEFLYEVLKVEITDILSQDIEKVAGFHEFDLQGGVSRVEIPLTRKLYDKTKLMEDLYTNFIKGN